MVKRFNMGWAQRSRQYLPTGTVCYLCGLPIEAGQKWNRDHVPAQRLFAKAVRQQFSPNLQWLYTHEACNSAQRPDEEYFVASFAGHVDSDVAQAVMRDLGDAARKGHGRGLIQDVINRFGRLVGPQGEVLYEYDTQRVKRFAWKLIRGIYYLELEQVLPDKTLGDIYIINPRNPPEDLVALGWFPAVRDTKALGAYSRVFDYKWLGWKDDELRAHAIAMLIWDRLIIATLFHDPSCACSTCIARRSSATGAK